MWLKCLIVFLKFTFSFVFKLNQICKWQYSSSQSVFFLSIVDIHFWFLLDSIYRQISYSTKIMLNWVIVVLQQCFTVLQPILSVCRMDILPLQQHIAWTYQVVVFLHQSLVISPLLHDWRLQTPECDKQYQEWDPLVHKWYCDKIS
jgi:hypothetical protein